MAKVLVVGGAGYVGGAASADLIDHGHDVWVLDDFSRGHRELCLGRGLTCARAGDRYTVRSLIERERFDAVMHFAAFADVAESVREPEKYFENNVEQTRALLETLLDCGIKRFIFSSTCAVFGDPGTESIHEDLVRRPINPYGESKLRAENIIELLAQTRGLQTIAFRYFNAAGAEEKLRTGEWHMEENHLIPRIFCAVIEGKPVRINGDDYPTPDGTCVRDYIHVSDLARAHRAGLERLLALDSASPGRFETYNLGSEQGYSVREVVDAVSRRLGYKIETVVHPRRPGDPPRLVASSKRAREVLGFSVRPHALDWIIDTAWSWEEKRRRPVKAVFLDRDGTINEDPGYLSKPEQLQLLPRVGEAIAKLQDAGFKIVVVSNQSGVGRGKIDAADLPRIHNRLDEMLMSSHARIDRYELCLHHPDEGCFCRKPRTLLLVRSAHAMNLDLSRSYMVGDKSTDVEVGWAAGCRASALVLTGEGKGALSWLKGKAPDFVGSDLLEVAEWILKQPRDV